MRVKNRIPGTVLIPGIFLSLQCSSQVVWQQVDSLYQPLPATVHVYKTVTPLDGKPNIAYYVEADMKDPSLLFTVDTSRNRRLTPARFFEKNDGPLLVVNTTFFSFTSNQSLNLVIRNGKIVTKNPEGIALKGKDTLKFAHVTGAAFGITQKRQADIGWTITGRSSQKVWVSADPVHWTDSSARFSMDSFRKYSQLSKGAGEAAIRPGRWRMQTAVGGGPVLMESGTLRITNNEERKFTGKAIEDRHPRTAIGYTKDQRLIILVVQGRFPGIAEGATLGQAAKLFRELGCYEAMNLDGGGSSCMLVNGKETIRPSDKEGQRAVPAVLLIQHKQD